ncbi:MAG: type II toxin-antitoxin system RelE/ParE family toxin [Sulfuritalea sp.]|nr:type II toxin-antitoxin system RelE/ParE family toxin [Sulfuritalea sp.]MBK8118705.1 type II toxin-antitoxin system RelE/ParE family toxin [Sulfuritalea sp.]
MLERLNADLRLVIQEGIASGPAIPAEDVFAKRIEQCQRIGNAPMGNVGREDLAPGVRMAALGRYVIFFRAVETTDRIERVLHRARNLPASNTTARKPPID